VEHAIRGFAWRTPSAAAQREWRQVLSGAGVDVTQLRRLTACGDIVAQEVSCPTEQARSVNQRNTDLIRQRASVVRASHPAFEQLIDEYVARQERETQILGTDVLCAIWVLRRAWQSGWPVQQGDAAGRPLRGRR